MEDEYVRKDYHDETIRRIEVLMERNFAKQETMNVKQEAMNTELLMEIKNLRAHIDDASSKFVASINDLMDRVSNLKTSQSNGFTRWGIIVALVVGTVQVAVSLLLR